MHTQSHFSLIEVHTLQFAFNTVCIHTCLPHTQCVYTPGFHTVREHSTFTQCAHTPAFTHCAHNTCLPHTQCAYTLDFHTVRAHTRGLLTVRPHSRLSHCVHTPACLAHSVYTLPACTQCAHTPAHTRFPWHAVRTLPAAHPQSVLTRTGPMARAFSGSYKRLSRIRCTLRILCAPCRRSAAGDFL